MTVENLLLSVTMAVAAAGWVLRRMALAADARSHVALPGRIALLHISLIFGAAAMLFFGGLLVWAVEGRARVGIEAVIGVLFSAALAAASTMTSWEELIEALFVSAGSVGWPEVSFGLVAAILTIAFLVTQRNKLVVMLVSPDVARTAAINVRRLSLLFLETFALTIALGLRYLAVLLMGALIILPAATASLASNLTTMLMAAITTAVAATRLGSCLADWLHRETGPLIVIIAAAFFGLSLLRRYSLRYLATQLLRL
jgi:ABC-type Mn2+/Zn2+ transport system permease subunit